MHLRAAYTRFIISLSLIGTAAAMTAQYRMNISSQSPSVEPEGTCVNTVFAMGESMIPLKGVDITFVSRIEGVILSPEYGKTDAGDGLNR